MVAKARRALHAEKAGHGGTLDPLGHRRAASCFRRGHQDHGLCHGGRKTYRFLLRWGEARATEDAEGEIVATSASRPERDAIEEVLPEFIGLIRQVPPVYSAIKVEGRRAYELARAQ